MAPPETITVAFSGHRTRRGRLAWGQRWMWDALVDLGPGDRRLNMTDVVTVPDRLTTDGVAAVLSRLVGRHELLRTTFTQDADGEPVQYVSSSGALTVRVRQVTAGSPGALADRFAVELAATSFDLAHEPPVRFGLVCDNGIPRAIALAMAQLGFDGWSHTVLVRELQDALGAAARPEPAGPREAAPAARIRQPLDQVDFEESTDGATVSAAATAYWRDVLERANATAGPRRRPRVEDPRFWLAEFWSRPVAAGCRSIAHRQRVLDGAVLLSALGALLGHRLGQPVCLPQVVFNNRYHPDTRRTLCHLAQAVPIVLDITGGTFADLVDRTSRQMLSAARFGSFDPLTVGTLMHGPGPHRGTHIGYPIVFNLQPRQEARSAAGPDAEPDPTTAPGVGSALRWADTVDEETLGCYINVYDLDLAHMTFWIDTAYLAKADLASIAFGAERLLATAATTDVELRDLGALTDVLPTPDLHCAGER